MVKYRTLETIKTFGLQPEEIPFNTESVEGTEEYAVFETNKGTKIKFNFEANKHIIKRID